MALDVPRNVEGKLRHIIHEAFAAMPVLPNQLPFNDMVMDSILKLDEFGVKTRSTPYWAKHVGKQVIFYNSTRVAWPCIEAHGYDIHRLARRALIGVGRLVEVRELTVREKKVLFGQFNNWTPKKQRAHQRALHSNDSNIAWLAEKRAFVGPYPFGLFFEDLRRFESPVPFAWPSGPVQEYKVPLPLVMKALRKIDVDPDKIPRKIVT